MIYLDNFGRKNFSIRSYSSGEDSVRNIILLDKNSTQQAYNYLYYSGSQELTVCLTAASITKIFTGTMEQNYSNIIADSDCNAANLEVSFVSEWNSHTKALQFKAPLDQKISLRLRRSNTQSVTNSLLEESTTNNSVLTENYWTESSGVLTPHAKSSFQFRADVGVPRWIGFSGSSTLYVFSADYATLYYTFTGDAASIGASLNAVGINVAVVGTRLTFTDAGDTYGYRYVRTDEVLTFTTSDTVDMLIADQSLEYPGVNELHCYESNHASTPTGASSVTKYYDVHLSLYPLGLNDSSVAQDAPSQLAYGKKFYTLRNEDIIATENISIALNNKLEELKNPKARMVVHVPFNYQDITLLDSVEVQLAYQNVDRMWCFTEGGIYLSWADSGTYRYKQFLVTGVRHAVDGEYTSVTLIEKI